MSKHIYNYEKEFYEFLQEIEDHLTTKGEYISDELIINCEDIRLNGVTVLDGDCIYLGGNVVKIGKREVHTVTSGETGKEIGERQEIKPIVELWDSTDGTRLFDLKFTTKDKQYHYILK